MKLNINDRFKQLLAPLTDDEWAGLEVSVKDEGCRDPLVVWRETNTLLDGHNRYEICTRNDIGYSIKYLNLEDEQAAFYWIIRNQLSRRNVTPEQASYLRGKRYLAEKKEQGGRLDRSFGVEKVSTPKTSERLADEYQVSDRTIRNDARFASSIDNLALEFGEDTKQDILRRDSGLTKADVKEIATIAKNEPGEAAEIMEMVKAKEAKNVKDARAKRNPHVAQNSGDNEWYTPKKFIEAARIVLGTIDLDPASSEIANKTVQAETFYTAEDNGIDKEWFGNVWLNPPYAAPLISEFVSQLEAQRHNVESFIVLVNNATETRWFHRLMNISHAICLPVGRVRFVNPDGEIGAPLQGQAILYGGDNIQVFHKEFRKFGRTLDIKGW
jgi:phage N-6-adenine-methyltransferase